MGQDWISIFDDNSIAKFCNMISVMRLKQSKLAISAQGLFLYEGW